MKIALFATCLADTLFPDVARATAVAAELSRGTIDTVLAKSDLEPGIEALMRGLRP